MKDLMSFMRRGPAIRMVIFHPSRKEVLCNHGDNLLELVRKTDVFIDAPCSGSVSCGKCRVKLLKGHVCPADDIERESFKLKPGCISACHSEVVADIEIDVSTIFAESIEEMRIDDLSKDS